MRAVATAATRKAAEAGVDAADLKKLARQAGDAAQLMKLLGNEKRLLVLCFLAARGEMTVGELVGVATPLAFAFLSIGGAICGEDFTTGGRTLASLGLDHLHHRELQTLLREGV